MIGRIPNHVSMADCKLATFTGPDEHTGRGQAVAQANGSGVQALASFAPRLGPRYNGYFREAFVQADAAKEAGRQPIVPQELTSVARAAGDNLANQVARGITVREMAAFLRGDAAAYRLHRACRVAVTGTIVVSILITVGFALAPLGLIEGYTKAKARKNVTPQDLFDHQFNCATMSLVGVLIGIKESLRIAYDSGQVTKEETSCAISELVRKVQDLQQHPCAKSRLGIFAVYKATRIARKLAQAVERAD